MCACIQKSRLLNLLVRLDKNITSIQFRFSQVGPEDLFTFLYICRAQKIVHKENYSRISQFNTALSAAQVACVENFYTIREFKIYNAASLMTRSEFQSSSSKMNAEQFDIVIDA